MKHDFYPFETNYVSILAKIAGIDPINYAKSRNYIDGAVTYLSPFISRGVISTQQIVNHLIGTNYSFSDCESLLKELAWRDYFQRVWQNKNINHDLISPQEKVGNHSISSAILKAETGIYGIDESIQQLYQAGYVHNHCRMYIASVVCNIAQSYWKFPARWMYYHLLDGDWASNACSWQWVAGANSSKKYYTNQKNISNYTRTELQPSFLNAEYEDIEKLKIPVVLEELVEFELSTELPHCAEISIDNNLPSLIYNYYNLDPLWHADIVVNRILLLEPSIFAEYPISKKCIDFAVELSKNIKGIQLFVGEFSELEKKITNKIYYKEHPLNLNYRGIEEQRDWINSSVQSYFPSFFGYWKKIEKDIKKQFDEHKV